MTMPRIGVMQELTRREKRQLRIERVRQDAGRIRAERGQTLANIQRETALTWIDGRYMQEQVQLIQEQLQEAQLQIEGAEIAFRTGPGSQADVFAGRAGVAMRRDHAAVPEQAWQERLDAGSTDEASLLDAVRERAVLRVVRPKAMTVAVILAGLFPIMWGSGTGSEIMQRIAAPMVGGIITAPLLSMFVIPAAYLLMRRPRRAGTPASHRRWWRPWRGQQLQAK